MSTSVAPASHAGWPSRLAAGLALLAICLPYAARADDVVVRRSEPFAGYVYPAGGQRGTTVRLVVGGQSLRGADAVHVSGEGVRGRVLLYVPPWRPLDAEESQALRTKLVELRQRLLEKARADTTPSSTGKSEDESGESPPTPRRKADAKRGGKKDAAPEREGDEKGTPEEEKEAPKLPKHPLLEDLESKTMDELQEIAAYFFQRRNPLQEKRSIAETVKIELTIAADAPPGLRDLRIVSNNGVTNPVRFQIGWMPEVREKEPNHPGPTQGVVLDLPVVVNGQILPEDTDRFRFRARAGQHIVLRAEARNLIPYQADSVPGWMQATLAVYDTDGRELAYADEYRIDPDPVLSFDVPRDGEYEFEVRDAIARGREDFVYRVSVGEVPFVTSIFPLGGRAGDAQKAEARGWNLPWDEVDLDTRGGGEGERTGAWSAGARTSNEVPYAVDSLPESMETEPNGSPDEAARIPRPVIVNGRIDPPGDVDLYRFEGRVGLELVAEVEARSLGSPLDSVVKVLDATGRVIAWNDDHKDPSRGLLTHHADSYVFFQLPKDGVYYVRVEDVQRHGGKAYAYRLRVSPPRPDFSVLVAPSSLNLPAGRTAVLDVHAVRRDGFDGPIDIVLQDAPRGFVLEGGRIPPGRDRIRVTLGAPAEARGHPVTLRLEARGQAKGKRIVHPVVPTEDMMQAFIYRHLVPSQILLAYVYGPARGAPTVVREGPATVRVPRGDTTRVRFRISGRFDLRNVEFVLVDAPKGISLASFEAVKGGLVLELRADPEATEEDLEDNLIVEAIQQREFPGRDGRPTVRRKYSVGHLPAIPITVR